MSRFIVSFDDVTNRLKRLANFFYDTVNDKFIFSTKVNIGDTGLSDGKLNAQDNNSSSTVYASSWSNSNYPTYNLRRRRSAGANLNNGDTLGALRFWTGTSSGDQTSASITSTYQGDGATFLSDMTFKVSNLNAFKITSDLGFRYYNTSGASVTWKVHASSASYTLTLPSTTGMAGQILATDGAGNLLWDNKTNVDITDYSFDSGAGQTNFDTGIALTTQRIVVTENGAVKREGATYDFTRSGTEVIFNYSVINSWVNVTVYAVVSLTDFHFDVSNSGQTAFNTGLALAGKRVIVYENGILKREGASFDYTNSGTTVTMNYTVRNAWVMIFVYT